MAEKAGVFGDTLPHKLEVLCVLRTPVVSSRHHDTLSDLNVVGKKLEEILGSTSYLDTRKLVVESVMSLQNRRTPSCCRHSRLLKNLGCGTFRQAESGDCY